MKQTQQRKHRSLMAVLGLFSGMVPMMAGAASFSDQSVIEEQTAFDSPQAGNQLVVQNIFGAIDVQGHAGDEIIIRANKTIEADSRQDLAQGQDEVGLRVENLGDRVYVFLDLPLVSFNATTGDITYEDYWQRNNHRQVDYRHRLDISIQVPQNTSLRLSAINDGGITVSGIDADSLNVSNINGPIDMVDVAGQTRVNAINKDVNIAYSRNPDAQSSYETINGDLNISFAGEPDAEVIYQTMHGDLYSRYQVTAMQPKVAVSEKRRSQGIKYQLNADSRLQLGDGGTEYRFKTLNGDIKLQ
jgi:DUF4097 and DUF4098 domain-containing protein YvlB